jgi:two-component system CitB family response regulator
MNVLIVEDDPMVEFIHRNYLEKGRQFTSIYSASTVAEATQLLQVKKIQLVLLDIHLKDGNGLDLLKQIRQQQQSIEVILITAADEASTVQSGLHLGVVDYLIKPFTYERFKKSIATFFKLQAGLETKKFNQVALDDLLNNPQLADGTNEQTTPAQLDKGLSPQTLEKIMHNIKELTQPFTIQELTTSSGLSHVSVRKYVSYLEDQAIIHDEVVYTKVGRPFKVFYLN